MSKVQENDLFGRWKVLKRNPDKRMHWWCECQCDLKTIRSVYHSGLISGYSKSCGCYQKEWVANNRRTHNETRTRLYNIWCHMKARCYIIKNSSYENYGGRGITVCKEWRESYETFRDWALDNGYNKGLTIEREDNNGNYEPNNCIWIPRSDQVKNRRAQVNKYLQGRPPEPLSHLAKKANMHLTTLINRLRLGQTLKEALSTPVRRYKRSAD